MGGRAGQRLWCRLAAPGRKHRAQPDWRATNATAGARGTLTFICDCLRVRRLTGEVRKEDVYTVSKITGLEKQAGRGA